MQAPIHPVTFRNRRGQQLFGIVHAPADGAPSDLAVILLSPGVKTRVAPHRLYNKLAEMLADCGCWVLRFDFYGLGDSEGTIGERLLIDLYASVALGRYVEDTWDAMDWMRSAYGVERFVLSGLCGGALTGALAAPSRPDVAGLLALGLPVMVTGSNLDRYKFMTTGQLTHLRKGYIRKLLSLKAWLRLLSFRSDFRLIWQSLRRGRRTAPPAGVPSAASPAGPAPEDAGNANPLFPPAFLTLLNERRPMLLLFSEMDRLWWEFDEKFLGAHRAAIEAHRDRVEIGIVPGANHVFTLEEWQDDVLQRGRVWMQRHFGRPSQPAADSSAA
jgi:alpha/beta superfamily hydrolase